jgi:aryl-alcohol dehydrogenase-like predicted oxidoreductase
MASVALSWILAKGSLPVVGLSCISRMNDAVKALKVQLSTEEISFLESPYQPKTVRAHN